MKCRALTSSSSSWEVIVWYSRVEDNTGRREQLSEEDDLRCKARNATSFFLLLLYILLLSSSLLLLLTCLFFGAGAWLQHATAQGVPQRHYEIWNASTRCFLISVVSPSLSADHWKYSGVPYRL